MDSNNRVTTVHHMQHHQIKSSVKYDIGELLTLKQPLSGIMLAINMELINYCNNILNYCSVHLVLRGQMPVQNLFLLSLTMIMERKVILLIYSPIT